MAMAFNSVEMHQASMDMAAQNAINSLKHQLAAQQHQIQQQQQHINFLAGENNRKDAELTNVYCTLVKRDRDIKAFADKSNKYGAELKHKDKLIKIMKFEKEVRRKLAEKLHNLHAEFFRSQVETDDLREEFRKMRNLCEKKHAVIAMAKKRITYLKDLLNENGINFDAMADADQCRVEEEKRQDQVIKPKKWVYKPLVNGQGSAKLMRRALENSAKITSRSEERAAAVKCDKDMISEQEDDGAVKDDSDSDTGVATDESRGGSSSSLMEMCENNDDPECADDCEPVVYRGNDAKLGELIANIQALLNPPANETSPTEDTPPVKETSPVKPEKKQKKQKKRVAKPKRRYTSLVTIARY